MGRTLKKLLSLLLAVIMLLSMGIPALAAGDEDIVDLDDAALNAEDGEAGIVLESEPMDPAQLGIPRLGEIGLTAEEIEDVELEDPDTPVRVSIFLTQPSALDAGYPMTGIGTNGAAIAYRNDLLSQQQAVTAAIESATGRPLSVKWNMTLALNAVSAWVRVGDIKTIETVPGVRSVVRENQYEPQTDDAAEPNTANTSQFMVGATAAWANGYTGAGSRIAIIDTGLDTAHQSFNADAFDHAIAEVRQTKAVDLLERSEVSGLAGQLHSRSSNYISTKIPYAYNYVDGNTTVNHTNDTEGEHGSHVAGIAAANRFIKSGSSYNDAASSVHAVGMAPDAQLLIMKVFGNNGGAYDSDYMVAIEDAIVLGCDSVNLSLGSSSQGFTFDNGYQDILNNLASRAHNENMVVTISAGNSYAITAFLETDLYADDVSMHTGGSPGTFVNSLCVAAAQNIGNTGAPLSFPNDHQVFYTDTLGTMLKSRPTVVPINAGGWVVMNVL